MSVQLPDHSVTQKQAITFAAFTVFGVAALLLGLALIIYAHYHERAYVFLGLGAGSFIGGIAGIVGAGSKIKAALSYGVIALGVMFAYDIFLYSYAVLYRGYNVGAWAARGFVDALLAPLLVAAAARNSGWSPQVGVSRRAVFYSTSLLVIALYFIATAVGGYYVRLYGGNWGRVVRQSVRTRHCDETVEFEYLSRNRTPAPDPAQRERPLRD